DRASHAATTSLASAKEVWNVEIIAVMCWRRIYRHGRGLSRSAEVVVGSRRLLSGLRRGLRLIFTKRRLISIAALRFAAIKAGRNNRNADLIAEGIVNHSAEDDVGIGM